MTLASALACSILPVEGRRVGWAGGRVGVLLNTLAQGRESCTRRELESGLVPVWD